MSSLAKFVHGGGSAPRGAGTAPVLNFESRKLEAMDLKIKSSPVQAYARQLPNEVMPVPLNLARSSARSHNILHTAGRQILKSSQDPVTTEHVSRHLLNSLPEHASAPQRHQSANVAPIRYGQAQLSKDEDIGYGGIFDTSTLGDESDDTMRDVNGPHDHRIHQAQNFGQESAFNEYSDDDGEHDEHHNYQQHMMGTKETTLENGSSLTEQYETQNQISKSYPTGGRSARFHDTRNPGADRQYPNQGVQHSQPQYSNPATQAEIFGTQHNNNDAGVSGQDELDDQFPSNQASPIPQRHVRPHRPEVIHGSREKHREPTDLKEMRDQVDPFEASENGEDSASFSSTPVRKRPQAGLQGSRQLGDNKRTFIELDYDEKMLLEMKYDFLNDESFDHDPKAPPHILPAELSSSECTLEERLKYFADQKDELRGIFFSRISMEDWEKSGDWFIDQFSDLMQQMKKCRRGRREINNQFEKELAAREELFRGKTTGLVDTMKRMKEGGQGVLRERTPS